MRSLSFYRLHVRMRQYAMAEYVRACIAKACGHRNESIRHSIIAIRFGKLSLRYLDAYRHES